MDGWKVGKKSRTPPRSFFCQQHCDVYLPLQNSQLYNRCYRFYKRTCLCADWFKANTYIDSITHLKVRSATLYTVHAVKSHVDWTSLAELGAEERGFFGWIVSLSHHLMTSQPTWTKNVLCLASHIENTNSWIPVECTMWSETNLSCCFFFSFLSPETCCLTRSTRGWLRTLWLRASSWRVSNRTFWASGLAAWQRPSWGTS